MKILFSPLGMTDPIKNDYDGPFLHILRHFRPDKAYLFMTKRVCELADQDDRYQAQAHRLCEDLGFACEIFELRYENIDNPQEYDIFYPLFEQELNAIHSANPGCQVLINLSSGTPQMKSACNLLALTAPFPVVPIQVTTPNESENYGSPGYDLTATWTNNIDNHAEMDPLDRSKVVKTDNLRYLFLREAAISHIDNYDYSAAANILEMVAAFVPPQAAHLVKAAQHRRNMLLGEAAREAKLGAYDIFPVKSSDAQKLFEYLLLLGIQQKTRMLMDFVRGISPALTRLFEAFLQEKCNRRVRQDYCVQRRFRPGHYVFKRDCLSASDPQLAAYYDHCFPSGLRDSSDLSCSLLLPMIEFDCGPQGRFANETVVRKAKDMRAVEEKIRNQAAHNIVAIGEEDFRRVAGISSYELLKDMQWLFKLSYSRYFRDGMDGWDSYEEMNKAIIRQLKGKA